MAFEPEAQAVATAVGPAKAPADRNIAAGRVDINFGIMNGETREGPRWNSVECCSSIS